VKAATRLAANKREAERSILSEKRGKEEEEKEKEKKN
jgi:hypothetical protein